MREVFMRAVADSAFSQHSHLDDDTYPLNFSCFEIAEESDDIGAWLSAQKSAISAFPAGVVASGKSRRRFRVEPSIGSNGKRGDASDGSNGKIGLLRLSLLSYILTDSGALGRGRRVLFADFSRKRRESGVSLV